MPRISADSVAEHVARQSEAVFDAAIALFIERGYEAVTLADIATAVGLARNSLYRYFPDKASILLRWHRTEMPVLVERSRQLATGDDPPAERLVRWAEGQIDYAREPEHVLMSAIGEAMGALPPEAHAELMDSHEQLMAPFRETLAETGLPADELEATADLLWGVIVAQTKRELRIGDDPVGRRRLAEVVRRLATADQAG